MNTLYLIITILILTFIFKNINEHYYGAITQLQAKGPQDLHLTVNNEKYLHPHYYNNTYLPFRYPYDLYIWNNPTRYRPAYYNYDYNYHLYPYVYFH